MATTNAADKPSTGLRYGLEAACGPTEERQDNTHSQQHIQPADWVMWSYAACVWGIVRIKPLLLRMNMKLTMLGSN